MDLSLNKLLKDHKDQDFKARAKEFINEYRQLVRKWKCDWQAKLDFLDGGNSGIVPKMQLRDVSEQIEKEISEEAKKDETKRVTRTP